MGLPGSKCMRQSLQCTRDDNGRVKFRPIPDKFETIEEVQQALMKAGVESSQLILGIDFTKSNLWTGRKSHGGRSLHHVDHSGKTVNPYQMVIKVLGNTLEAFDDDKLIPAYGFGDATTANKSVFSFTQGDRPCNGFAEVLARYDQLVGGGLHLAGPAHWAPIIDRAIAIAAEEQCYNILVIVGDGQVTNAAETRQAIVRASNYPLSIVAVGVGDGPWDMMEAFDDKLPTRKFDNFQFFELNKTLQQNPRNFEAAFALNALMEVPAQYDYIKRLGLLDGRGCPPTRPSDALQCPIAEFFDAADSHIAIAQPALAHPALDSLQRQGSWRVQLNAMWNGPLAQAVPLA